MKILYCHNSLCLYWPLDTVLKTLGHEVIDCRSFGQCEHVLKYNSDAEVVIVDENQELPSDALALVKYARCVSEKLRIYYCATNADRELRRELAKYKATVVNLPVTVISLCKIAGIANPLLKPIPIDTQVAKH